MCAYTLAYTHRPIDTPIPLTTYDAPARHVKVSERSLMSFGKL